jgi:hypothetical protein
MRRGETSEAALNSSVTLSIENHQHLIRCEPNSYRCYRQSEIDVTMSIKPSFDFYPSFKIESSTI